MSDIMHQDGDEGERPEPWSFDFRSGLEHLINRFSKENGSNTPDFILAEYLDDCLRAFDAACYRRRVWWYGDRQENKPSPCSVCGELDHSADWKHDTRGPLTDRDAECWCLKAEDVPDGVFGFAPPGMIVGVHPECPIHGEK